MSLRLDDPNTRDHVEVKTWGIGPTETVFFGDHEVSMSDFLEAAYYVLTNTNLRDGDPRPDFLEQVARLQPVPGWESLVREKDMGDRRLGLPLPDKKPEVKVKAKGKKRAH